MKFRPESNEPLEGIPSAAPGRYTMSIRQYREDVTIAKTGQVKDVIDFVGDNPEGVTVGAALWISGPSTRPDGSLAKGNLWQYRRLAEALGAEALQKYEQKDADGFSCFSPRDFMGKHVLVEVGRYGVDSVEAADPAVVKALSTPPTPPTPPANQAETKAPDDDIPF